MSKNLFSASELPVLCRKLGSIDLDEVATLERLGTLVCQQNLELIG